MIIVDTYWEKRNLGVESAKIIIDHNDTIEEIEQMVKQLNKEYIEVDIPTGYIQAIRSLEMKGFNFMEMSLALGASIKDIIIPKTVERAIRRLSYELASKQEIGTVLEIINSGKMFLTDKISLNPNFGVFKAGNRYVNWTEQLLDTGSQAYVIKNREKLLGFEVVQIKDDMAVFCLGGSFPESGAGSGLIMSGTSYAFWKDQGIAEINTSVSSNNLTILKIHEFFGLKIQDMRYIMVKNIINT